MDFDKEIFLWKKTITGIGPRTFKYPLLRGGVCFTFVVQPDRGFQRPHSSQLVQTDDFVAVGGLAQSRVSFSNPERESKVGRYC